MPNRETRARLGHRQATEIALSLGRELRTTRRAAGLRQEDVGRSAGISHAQVSRIERGRASLTIDQACRVAAALGLVLSIRTYPAGDPIRDLAHVRLLERLRVRLDSRWEWRTEVPLPIAGDRRAWDAVISMSGTRIAVEAETRLTDIQALVRKLALKRRDGRVTRMILVVADTRSNRAALAMVGASLSSSLPLNTRATLAALADARDPGADGLVVL